MRSSRLNVLLIEILIAVLFFAVSSTTIVQVFAGAHQMNARGRILNEALLAAEDAAEQLYAAENAGDMLEMLNFTDAGAFWQCEADEYVLQAELEEIPTEAGTLRKLCVRAVSGEETLLTLPRTRYISGEVAR